MRLDLVTSSPVMNKKNIRWNVLDTWGLGVGLPAALALGILGFNLHVFLMPLWPGLPLGQFTPVKVFDHLGIETLSIYPSSKAYLVLRFCCFHVTVAKLCSTLASPRHCVVFGVFCVTSHFSIL